MLDTHLGHACEHRCRSTIYIASSSYYISRVLILCYYVLYPAARVRCRVAGDSHELLYTAVSRQISSRSDCGLAMDQCEASADASFARAVWCAHATAWALFKKKSRQRLLCLFILPFLSFGLRYSPRQLTAATELQQSCTEDGLSHLSHLIGWFGGKRQAHTGTQWTRNFSCHTDLS